MTRSKARVAVAGYGQWGKNLVRNFAELGALAAVAESSSIASDACRAAHPDVRVVDRFETLLTMPDVDAVVIATPAATHAALAHLALDAGKHLFVEKPLALTVADGRSLVEHAQRADRVLMVGHLLRYHPAIVALRDLVDGGALGRIRYVYSTRLNLGRVRREENILWSFAPHDVSVVLSLIGERPDAVQAHAGAYLQRDVADVTVSLLSFPSGTKAHFFVSWLHPYKEQKLIVVGENKMAVFDDLEPEHKLRLYPHAIGWGGNVPVLHRNAAEAIPFDRAEPLRVECEHFLDCVAHHARPLTDGVEGLRVLEVLERCQLAISVAPRLESATPMSSEGSVHPSAFIDVGVEIGEGTTIWHVCHVLKGSRVGARCRIGQNVVIGPNVSIGDRCKIQNNVSVYEGVTLEDDVFCGPSVVFTNVKNPRSEIPRMHELARTLVRCGATVGANATIVCGTTIGRYAFVAAGAVVTHDVPDHTLVMGNPARPHGHVCRCVERLTFLDGRAVCGACGRRYTQDAAGVSEEPAR